MIIDKNFKLIRVLGWTYYYLIWITLWVLTVMLLYHKVDLRWLTIPVLPLSLIGTAVAFYIGFKNNSSYDRMWEARKIWGAIVNSSRAWGTYVKGFVSNQFTDQSLSPKEIQSIKRTLIYRHIAWLYALRSQLLVVTHWEHANQQGRIGRRANEVRAHFGVNMVDDEVTRDMLVQFLPENEYERLIAYKNTATQIIDQQSMDLAKLREEGLIDDFRHMQLQELLYHFYEHQGKAERIKKFPLPRQYGGMSIIFVYIFIFLLPFGMVSEFAKLANGAYGYRYPSQCLWPGCIWSWNW